jgi:hypothetical protein
MPEELWKLFEQTGLPACYVLYRRGDGNSPDGVSGVPPEDAGEPEAAESADC